MAFQSRQRPQHAYQPKQTEGNNKYPEKSGNYSPSARYFHGGSSQPPQHQNQGPHHTQGPNQHRRQHKRDTGGHTNDRLAKQNDVIIRLLKEIRDRLPAPIIPEGGGPTHADDRDREYDAAQQQTESSISAPDDTEPRDGNRQDNADEQFDDNEEDDDEQQPRYAITEQEADSEE